MKIAFITNLCPHYRYKLFKMLSDQYGFDFYFFDDPQKTKEEVRHLEIHWDGRFRYLPPKEIFKRLVKKKYDVIIKCTNNKWSFFMSLFAAKLTGAKLIVWHTIWYYPKTLQYKFFSKFLIYIFKNYTDAIVVYGEHGKKFLIEKGINPDKIFIAWQAVDNELYGREIREEEIENIKKELNIGNKKVVLYVGRVIRLKGIEYLLEALKSLGKNNFVFLAVGDGKLKSMMGNYCKENFLNRRVVGLKPYYEMPSYYKVSTVLVLPSITTKTFKEPWGLVVNEAFNQGCPVVVTDAVGAGVGGLVKNGINGFVVPEKNSKALAEAIDKILNDNSLREKLSKNAKEEIKIWTYERQAKGFLDAVEYSLMEL